MLIHNLHFYLASCGVSVNFVFVMKTYSIEVSAERALPILEADRSDLVQRLASLDQTIAAIKAEMGFPQTTTNGHPVRKRTRSVVSALSEGSDFLASPLINAVSSIIQKTKSGRATKGHTEAMILDYMQGAGHGILTAPRIANAIKANYSTVNRSLKKLEKRGSVYQAHGAWSLSDKLKEQSQ